MSEKQAGARAAVKRTPGRQASAKSAAAGTAKSPTKPAEKAAAKTPAAKTPVAKTPAKKAPAKQAPAKPAAKAPAQKAAAKPATKAPAQKAAVKPAAQTAAQKTAAQKTAAQKTAAAKGAKPAEAGEATPQRGRKVPATKTPRRSAAQAAVTSPTRSPGGAGGKYSAAARAAIAAAQAEQQSRAEAETAARAAAEAAAHEEGPRRNPRRELQEALEAGSAPAAGVAAARPAASTTLAETPAAKPRRRWLTRSRLLSLLSLILAVAGIGLLAYPVATDVYAGQAQEELQEESVTEFTTPQFRQKYKLRRVEVGEGLTRLRIPKLGVDTLVVEGTTVSALRAGAGHYADTPLPGEVGNVGIAGHRTTYGRPFGRLDELGPGDQVILETPLGSYTYAAVKDAKYPWIVTPLQTEVLDQVPGKRLLTLTTCHPKGSARQRLILRLELVSHTGVLPDEARAARPTPTTVELPST